MDINKKDELHIPVTVLHPAIFTLVGFLSGFITWWVDALIDSFLIEPDMTLLDSLFSADETEIWMRILVVIVMTSVGYFASRSAKKSLELNRLLYKYQNELEELVLSRTKALEEKTEQLEKLANLDPLTSIYNRRKFMEIANEELSRFNRHKHTFSIFMLDIDNFKSVNDNYGHDVGDEVIKTLAQLIKDTTRDHDFFARWGGEEFIIISPESSPKGRSSLAEKIISLIAAHKFDKAGKVTISIGVTSSKEGDDNIDDIIKRADQGLYRAKDAGKNQYMIVD